MSTREVVELARAALDRGDPIAAFDIAAEDERADDPDLAYVRVLALARLGDWQSALSQYEAYGLDRQSDVDCLALKARLLKDRAFASPQGQRANLLRQARDAYQAAYQRTNEDFAAINAASLSAMIGERTPAEALARALLDGDGSSPEAYWDAVTRAEALVILNRLDEARQALQHALILPGASAAARGTTFQQLRRLLPSLEAIDPGMADQVLHPIRPRRVAHFCGRMLRPGQAGENRLAAAVAAALKDEDVGMVVGALACGSDIIIAEQALALGAELHVVLPFDREDFIAQSVGDDWLARFEACERSARGIYYASRMRYVFDDGQFAFGSRTAMGIARLRAGQLHAETVQIAVSDEDAATGTAGTPADMALWQAAGGRTRQLPTMGVERARMSASSASTPAEPDRRALRVLVFADFQGFSRLPEHLIPEFWQSIMGGCAQALQPYSGDILAMNTWGDGLHIVFDGVKTAATALTSLRDSLAALDLSRLGIEGAAGMRIAGHFGSVYEIVDPVTGRLNFYGTEVSRAARLEAVTLPGRVYITEPMAAALEMSCGDEFRSRYVGRLALPKNFGSERIYALERREDA